MAETAYIVLRRDEDGGGIAVGRWEALDTRETASSAEAAIRQALKDKPAVPLGTYVAVPARSWKPVTVKAETQTVLRLEEAGA